MTEPMDQPTPPAVTDPFQAAVPVLAPPVAPLPDTADPGAAAANLGAAAADPGAATAPSLSPVPPTTGSGDHGNGPAPAGAPGAAPAPQWGEYGAVAPALPVPSTGPAPGRADPLRGVLAGVIAAVAAALGWALLVALTHDEVAFAAVGVGYLVGWAVHRYGGTASTGLAAASPAMAGCGILLGFVLAHLFIGAHDLGIGFLDAVDTVTTNIGWLTFITHATTGLGWLFLAFGAFGAFRLVAQKRRG